MAWNLRVLKASAVEIEGCAVEPVYMSRRLILAPVEEKGCIQGLRRKPRKSGFTGTLIVPVEISQKIGLVYTCRCMFRTDDVDLY